MTLVACPHCGRQNDGHAGPDPSDEPSGDDVGLCFRCGGLFAFVETPFGLSSRKFTPEELREVMAVPQIQAALASHAAGGGLDLVIKNYRSNL